MTLRASTAQSRLVSSNARRAVAMAELRILPQEQVIRLVAQADPREFSVLLGAGASRSSGVPLASEMIGEWRELAFREQALAGASFDDWCKAQPWFESPAEYSELFESLYPDERARQKYVEPKVEGAFPGWGYLYLANIIRAGHFNVVFTTNFDDLVNVALIKYVGYNAVVCSADSSVATINASTERAKIIKLHGDYLFKHLKNTVDDLERLDPNMHGKFGEFAQQCGMLVLGYAGRDRSIMQVLAEQLADDAAFPTGIYWGVHKADEPRPDVLDALAAKYPRRLRLFECPDFDVFMARLHEEKRLSAPLSIQEPVTTAVAGFQRLIEQTGEAARANASIKQQLDHLREQLKGSIAQAGSDAAFDLFEAHIALGNRDYRTGRARIDKYLQQKPNDSRGLTLLGTALAMQGEEEGAERLSEDAAARWRDAIKTDPGWAPPRYNLVNWLSIRRQYIVAISECEELLRLVPKDLMLRRTLAQLYFSAGRFSDALKTVDALIQLNPDQFELLLMRATVLEAMGLIPEAVSAAERATRLAPAEPLGHVMLAQGRARLGKLQEASASFMQAMQLDPHNPSIRMQAGIFFCTANSPLQAIPHLEEAVSLAPESAEAHGWLAQAYAMAGRPADAVPHIERAVQLSPHDSRILSTAGRIFAMTNRPADAERHLQEAIRQNPAAPDAYMALAMLFWGTQRPRECNDVIARLAQFAPAAAQQVQQQLSAMGPPGLMARFASAGAAAQGAGGGQGGWLPELMKFLTK